MSKLRLWNRLTVPTRLTQRARFHGGALQHFIWRKALENRRKVLTLREYIRVMQRLAFAILGVAVVVAGIIGWLGLSYLAMPVSTLGVAYVIGARVALTADHVHAIAKGQTPTFEFRRRAQDSSNKYVWQRGKIERPIACLYYETDAGNGAIVRPGSCPDQHRISTSGDQLYFSVEPGDALRIGVSNKPLENSNVTNGALYEAEGEIGIGKSERNAAWFKIALDAEWLNVLDPPVPADAATDPDQHSCKPATRQSLRDPIVLGILPRVAARLCQVEPEKPGRPLFLVHFQSGPLQWTDWTNRLGCRALLYRLIPSPSPGDLAGCIGGPWGGFDRTDLAVSFFEFTPSGDFAVIR
jgi:hypothetical protein